MLGSLVFAPAIATVLLPMTPFLRSARRRSIVVGIFALLASSLAEAAPFTCSSGNVDCLIAAITAANGNGEVNTIQLDGSTFTLVAAEDSSQGPIGLPTITGNILIEGAGSTIERSSAAGTPEFRLFFIDTAGNLTLNNLTIRNGSLQHQHFIDGGAMLNVGTLTITNSTVNNNRAGDNELTTQLAGSGGAIANIGSTFIRRSTITNNRAGDATSSDGGFGGCGGGIASFKVLALTDNGLEEIGPAILEISESTLSNNRAGDSHLDAGAGGFGGGVCSFGGATITISKSTFNANVAGKGLVGGSGGGLEAGNNVRVDIINSTFFQNSAGGALHDGTTFGGFGGAITVDGPKAVVNIIGSTIVFNSAGLIVPAMSDLNGKGGAINVVPFAFEDPNGGPPDTSPHATANIKNTIIFANNFFFVSTLFTDCFAPQEGDFIDQGYNTDELISCGFTAAKNSRPNTDPLLAVSLGDNGGPTQTLALCRGPGDPASCSAASPVIDAIPNGVNGCGTSPLDQDQRGVARPGAGNGDACDIGAYEVSGQAPAITSASSTTFTVGVLGSFTVTTTGLPVPSVGISGTLPSGVMFTDNGNGTATISGTPTQTGPFSLVLTAENGVSPNAPQNFTLSVVRPPAITSANNTTFTAGVAGSSFTVTTSGVPTPAITVSAGLPDGVTLTDNGDGTGTLAGTPTAAGTFVVTLTAANGVSPDATQTFTLHVNASPASLAPSSVVFGTVLLNSVQFQELTLTNLATIPLQNIQVTLELGAGTQGGDYVLLNQCGSSLAASASCTIRITLNALHAGTPTATIQVSDSGAGSPRRVPVTATVLTAGATFNPPQLQFGTTKVGSTQTKSTRLTNTGPLRWSSPSCRSPERTLGISPSRATVSARSLRASPAPLTLRSSQLRRSHGRPAYGSPPTPNRGRRSCP